MINNLTINGVTIGQSSSYYTLKEARGFGSGEVDTVRFERPGFHGSKVPRAYWRARTMRFLIGVKADSISTYAEKRRDLLEAFDLPRDGLTTMTFTTTDNLDLQCDVQLAGPIEAPLMPGEVTIGEVWVSLIAPNPLFQSQTLSEEDITFADGTGVINNTGNAPVFPEVTVYGDVSGDIEIENNTLGRTVSTTGLSLGSAEYMNIDMENETIVKNDAANLYEYINDDDFWWLTKGNNTINISATTGGSGDKKITVSYRVSYLGI